MDHMALKTNLIVSRTYVKGPMQEPVYMLRKFHSYFKKQLPLL